MTDILFLSPVGVIGGAERVLLQILRSQCRLRPADRIGLLLPCEGPLLQAAIDLGVRVKVVPWSNRIASLGDTGSGSSSLASRVKQLEAMSMSVPDVAVSLFAWRQAVAEFSPRLIYSNGLKTHLVSSILSRKGRPVIWHLHDFYSHRRIARALMRPLSARVSVGVAISEAVAGDTRQAMPRLPVKTILNGVCTQKFAPTDSPPLDLDNLAGLTRLKDVIRVGLLATYGIWKGQDVFLKAAAAVVEKSPDTLVRFYIIGGPIYGTAAQWTRLELEQQVRQLTTENNALGSRVGFVDFQADTAPIYQSLDIVIHASTKPEPFGLTIAEAMSCGKAVIYSNAGGACEIAENGSSGIGTSPGCVPELASAMTMLLADSSIRKKLGTAARQRILQRFDESRFNQQMAELIDEKLQSSGR